MISIVPKRNFWLIFSGTLVTVNLIAVAVFGLNFGVDFTGGSLLDLKFATALTTDELRGYLESQGFSSVRVQSSESGEFLIRTEAQSEDRHQALLAVLREKYGEVNEERFDFVGPVIGQELKKKAAWSIAAVLGLILFYVAWVFRHVSEPVKSWKYGMITIITAFHDVIIPIGVFAVLGQILNYQIDAAFVAAILTILGYSINDTIVVFDRTRENLKDRSSAETFAEVVNRSVNQTIARSVNTALTTLLALFAVFIFGGETTKEFALALIIGITTGAYSSIFVASPLLVVWERWRR